MTWNYARVEDREWATQASSQCARHMREAIWELIDAQLWRTDSYDPDHHYQDARPVGVAAALEVARWFAEFAEAATNEMVLALAEAKAHGASWEQLAYCLSETGDQPKTRQGIFKRYAELVRRAITEAGGDATAFHRHPKQTKARPAGRR